MMTRHAASLAIVIFRQFVDDDLGCGSYLVGDENEGAAVVVDPAYAIDQYLDEAETRGVTITAVLETHTHADHVSGHGRLALDHGCTVHVHAAADAEYLHEPLEDSSVVEIGSVRIHTIHTPGHRPEHCAFAVADRSRGDDPWLVLTGDSLFIGDAARPDLAVEPREGAAGLFHSLRRLAELPDGVELFPGHVAGSLCGVAMSSRVSSTIGFERRFNHALLIGDEDAFVDESVGGGGAQLRPPNMERIVALNRGPFLGAPPPLQRIAFEDARRATALDVRDVDTFAAGHAPGAINVPVDGSSFATKSGFLLSTDEAIVIHAASTEQAERAARGLRSVALLELVGYTLADGGERLSPIELEEVERLLATSAVDVLDVREKDERDGGYIAGTRHIPYRLLRTCADGVGTKPVVTICNTGARAGIAASILTASGIDARPVLHAGVEDWQKRGGHTVEFRRCGG
jgi:glyoxylase-like metal-dependent hydrolase (beta-lactamase superfamily II)/rhodanese-related sulfurtransferase